MEKGKTISTPISDEEVEVVVYKFIENFEKEREKQGLFQQDIENLTGISQQAISRIEKHKNKPSINTTVKYLMALGIDINSLFKNTGGDINE